MLVGMRVDARGAAKLSEFAPNVKTFIHVDIDESEMGKNVRPHIELVADARLALGAMVPQVTKVDAGRAKWLGQIDKWRGEHPLRYKQSNGQTQPADVLIDMYKRARIKASFLAQVRPYQS